MLVRKNLFKVFTFAVGYLWAQAYGSDDRHSELGSLSEEIRKIVGKFSDVKQTTRKLKRLKRKNPNVEEQVFQLTRGFCQLLAWSNYVPKKDDGVETDWEDYNKCLSLINVVESLPMSEEDRALFCASGAKIRLKKLEYLVKQDGFEDSEKEEKLRKIYDLFMESRSIRDRKQCRVEIAGLILRWGYSPTGSLEEDYEIAAKMLPYPSPRGGVGGGGGGGATGEAGEGVSGGALAHLDDSLPNGNSAALKEEERQLRLPLEAMKREIDQRQAAPAAMDDLPALEAIPLFDAVLGNVPAAMPAAEIAPATGMQKIEMEVVSASMDDVEQHSPVAMDDLPALEAVPLSSVAEAEDSDDDFFSRKKRKRTKKKRISDYSDDEEVSGSLNTAMVSSSVAEALAREFVTPLSKKKSRIKPKHFTFEDMGGAVAAASDDVEPGAKRQKKKEKKSPASNRAAGSFEAEEVDLPIPGSPAFSEMIRKLGASARL
ncbi:MAG: hypothetical protein NT128_03240 [Proteobacteria bacterium]|nr:hypothetical protein [Pseudomonadota bacterium]